MFICTSLVITVFFFIMFYPPLLKLQCFDICSVLYCYKNLFDSHYKQNFILLFVQMYLVSYFCSVWSPE